MPAERFFLWKVRLRKHNVLHQLVLRGAGLFALGAAHAAVGAVGAHEVGARVVGEVGRKKREEALLVRFFSHGHHELDAVVEVPRHPVGGRDEDVFLAAVVEVEDAAVL